MQITNRDTLLNEKKLFISYIVPVFNEAGNLVQFTDALTSHAAQTTANYEIIFINDGSKDASLEVIEKLQISNPSIKFLSFSRNFGKELALTAGLEHCQGDVAILIDADLQHPLETTDDFLKHWAEGYDMVYGVRDSRENETVLKRVFSKYFYRLLNCLSDTPIPANAGDFRLLDRKVIDAINSCGEYNRFMKGLYAWVGFKSVAVSYKVKDRSAGKSSFSFFRLTELALTGILSFSDIPLRIWSLIGMIISGISLIYAIIIIFDTLFFGVDVPGFATISVAIMFFGGVQLISIGILGEYIARIFREVKNRPKYIVEKQHGFERE